MEIDIQLCDTVIAPDHKPLQQQGAAGAEVEFRGVVRGSEDGRTIKALNYEAYAGMAEQTMRRILEELAAEHPCLRAIVIHRHGVVPVGDTAIFVRVEAGHRAEAFALLAAFMDRLKKDVPVWKVEAIPL